MLADVIQAAPEAQGVGNNVILAAIIALGLPGIVLEFVKWRQGQSERAQSHAHDMQRLAHDQQVQSDSTAMNLVAQLMTRTGTEEMEERRRTNERLDALTGELGGFRSTVENLTVNIQDLQIQASKMERDLRATLAAQPETPTAPAKKLGARPASKPADSSDAD